MRLYKYKLKIVEIIEEKYKDKRGREKSRLLEKLIKPDFIIAESHEAARINYMAQHPGVKVKYVYLVGPHFEIKQAEFKEPKKSKKKPEIKIEEKSDKE
jgi:hypothetical protein